jgi:hypothetical protein
MMDQKKMIDIGKMGMLTYTEPLPFFVNITSKNF